MHKYTADIGISSCGSYQYSDLYSAIEKVIDQCGFDIGKVKGKKILLKPNMLEAVDPEKQVTTHPTFVKAVASILKKHGAQIFIGDSPGESFSMRIRETWEKTDMFSALESETEMAVLEDKVEYFPLGHQGVPITQYYYDCDLIVNLPKVKSHNLTAFTCGVKNILGLIPGKYKKLQHKRYPYLSDFCEFIADFTYQIKPQLTLVDGVYGLQGDGPGVNGTPKELDLILGSTDVFLLDIFLLELLGIPIEQSPIHSYAAAKYYPNWQTWLAQYGELIDQYRISGYICPFPDLGKNRLETDLLKNNPVYALRMKRPVIDDNKCTLCGHCISNCPVGALEHQNNQIILLEQACISCQCCCELCVNGAVKMSKRW